MTKINNQRIHELLRVLAVVWALSVSGISAAESLVTYEGTATVRSVSDVFGQFPVTVSVGDEFRFRATVDSSTRASTHPELVDTLGGVYYQDAIRDLDIWVHGVPVPLPPTTFSSAGFNNLIHVRNDADNSPFGSPGTARLDLLFLIWRQTAVDGKVFEFLFSLEDHMDASMLSSQAIPTEVDYSLANGWGIGFNVYVGDRQQWDFLDMVVTNFVTERPPQTVSSLLQQLLTDSTGVGPGKSLANKATLAQTYHEVGDIRSTCAVLKSFLHEVRAQSGKKLTIDQAEALSADAVAITSAIACE
jgi:hypothetical protein